jgi:tRNA threonylcarbamoyladenosine biosynthesis protein TsaB
MSYLLAIDTTGVTGSLALAEDGRLLEEVVVAAPDGFGHILFSQIDALLARHAVTLRQIACFAAAAGPGSFTGVRVGLTAVKGLAEAARRQVVAVSNLRAQAWFGAAPLRAPWMDARRGEVYGAVYDADLRLVQEETVAPYADWVASIPAQAQLIPQGPALARAIAAIAWAEFSAGRAQDAAEIEANYVRRSDAELHWREP